MIIGIDGNEANIERRVGVNEYGFQLLWNIWKLQDKWKNKHSLIVYLKNNPLPDMPEETENYKYKVIPGDKMWILTRLMPELFFGNSKPEILLSPSHYAPLFSPVPVVCSIMDLGYLEFSGQFTKKDIWQLKLWSAISILISKKIIAISNSTKKDIVRHYPFTRNKIQVTYLGYDSEKFNKDIPEVDVRRVRNRYSIVDDYILYLGTLKPSKNIEGLIEAFAIIHVKQPKLKLVIAGKKGWQYHSIFEKAERLGLNDNIVFTDYVPESGKPGLIKGAKVFVLPSFWEGFGLDTLNAMGSGVPVVVSNVGSLPEVVGEAGVLVDPNDIYSISDGILEVISGSESKYNEYIKKGLLQAKKFSWIKTAEETLEILESCK